MMKYTYRILCLNEDTSIKVLDYNSIHKIKCYEDFKSLEDNLNKIGTIIGYSRFTKTKLSGWYYHNKECQAIGYGEGSKDRWLAIENKLRELVEKEFIRVGCTIEYVDETDKLDEWFIKQSGYEKTMVVSI